eukprot:TRINITY_DN27597_c0_g1_i1.p1 TRINITY_DN27597_c0_g1~~TRINITY_DN27597_c0_g1_i1.p1  ORF type:complete len:543 (+),score=120.48 TRINITY_DN27597_c0_g1_i1:47-1630(+)
MTNKLKYQDLCTASYYGDLKMVKKLLGDEEVAEGEEIDFDAQEEKEEKWADQVSEKGIIKTYSNAVRFESFGFGFDIYETEDTSVFSHLFKCSRKSSDVPATPLHWAVLGAEIDMVKYLLRKGAKTRTVAGAFDAIPKDIAVANDLPVIFNLFNDDEARTLGQIEEIRDELSNTFKELSERTKAITSRKDIEISKGQHESQAVAAISQDRSEILREPARSHEYIKFLSVEEAAAANSKFDEKSCGKEFFAELVSNIPGSTVGQFSLLTKRFGDFIGSNDGRLPDIQLLASLLFSCDTTALKELLFLPPDSEEDIPNINEAILADSSTVSTEPTSFGVLSHFVNVVAQSPLSNVDGFIHFKDPSDDQKAKLEELQEGSIFAFGGLTVISVNEESKKESMTDTAGFMIVFSSIKEGVNLSEVCGKGSRFPSEKEVVVPCFSSFRVTKVEPQTEGSPTVVSVEPSDGPVVSRIETVPPAKLLTEFDKWQKLFLNLRKLKSEALHYHQPAPEPDNTGDPEADSPEEEQAEE